MIAGGGDAEFAEDSDRLTSEERYARTSGYLGGRGLPVDAPATGWSTADRAIAV